jgi:hypothetical protein
MVFRPPDLRSGGGCFGPPSPSGLGRFVQWFFHFPFVGWQEIIWKKAPRDASATRVFGGKVFGSRFTKFCRFLGQHAPSNLARRRLLVLPPRRNGRNDRRSSARGSHVPRCFLSSASRESYAPSRLACLVVPVAGVLRVLGGWGSTVAHVPHAPTPTAAPPTSASVWVVLLFFFFQIVLNFCSVSIFPSHCFVHRLFWPTP